MNRLLLRQPVALLFSLISQLNAAINKTGRRISTPFWTLLADGRPIRTTLTLLVVLPVTMMLIALGFTINHIVQNKIKTEQAERLKAQASYFAQNIDQAINRHLIDIKSRAALLPKFNLHADHEQLRTWMLTVQSEINDYSWIGFADRDGIVRVSTGPGQAVHVIAATPWFQQGLRQPVVIKAVNVAPPFDKNNGQLDLQPRAIYLAAPVHTRQGDLAGVLIGYLDWNWIGNQHTKLRQELTSDQQADVFVVTNSGHAHLISKAAWSVNIESLASFQAAKGHNSSWSEDTWRDHQDYLSAYAKLARRQGSPDSDWMVLVRRSTDSIHAITSTFTNSLWFIILSTALSVVAVMGLLLRMTLRPIEALVNTVNTVANHGGHIALTRPAPFEIQVLTKAVNRMIQSIRDREIASRAKTQLLADISHEIRTPLHGLIGHAELLKSRLADPEDQADMHRLIYCAKEMTALVNDALDLSAIELQKLRLNPQPVVLKELVDFNVRMFRSLAAQQGLFFDLALDADPDLRLMVDRLRFGQILRNLFSNAVKFTAQGGVRVVIQASMETPASTDLNKRPDVMLTIDVSDSGIGISQDQQSKLFTRYHQAPSDPETEMNHFNIGSGLGLSVTHGLVKSMGGHIDLQSEPGLGTCVRVSIPLPLAQRSLSAGDSAPGRIRPHRQGPKLRILLIEDAPKNREVMQRWLIEQGNTVVTAESGKMGLAFASGQTFDLILLDLELPDQDGITIARLIRERAHANARAKIFALSGRTSESDHQISVRAGIDLHIDKPLDFDRFKNQLGLVGRNTFGSS